MKELALILLLCAFSLPSVSQPPPLDSQLQAQSDVRALKHGRRKPAIFSLHKNALNAIPALIEAIDDKDPFDQIELKNPILSGVPKEAFQKTYMGVLAAYTIELILGKEALRGNQNALSPRLDPEDCVYDFGILHRDGETITRDDLAKVKALYQKWWDTNKDKSLQELRQEWIHNKRPLSGTPYRWY